MKLPPSPAPLLIGAALFAATGLRAQNVLTVPGSATHADAPALLAAPGIGLDWRIQVLIRDTELTALVGRELTGLKLRRDSSISEALPQASGQILVHAGTAASQPESAARDFALNLPNPVERFRGTVAAPSSTVDPNGPSWAADQAISIDFQQPFVYQGGPLCIDIEVLAAAGVWWPIDAIDDPAAGSHVSSGAACGRLAPFVETAGVRDSGLVIGRTARFDFIGAPSAPAFLLLGFGLLGQPIDLGAVGAPGCQLLLAPVAAIPTMLSSAVPLLDHSGRTNVDVQIPPDTGLFGAPLAAQFAELGAGGLTTSNALLCQIAAVPPLLPMVSVISRGGEVPDVVADGVPVLGLVWR
jgi:hypothetical protein